MSAGSRAPRADAPAQGTRIHTLRTDDGVAVVVHRLGPEDGVPIILVPGTFSNHAFWLGTRGTGFARTLAERGFEAWVVDPRGHGLSQRPGPDDRWDFDDWAHNDLTAVIEAATRHRPALLVGHSAGGAAALAALAVRTRLRERVRGIVTIATPVPWLQPMRRVGAYLTLAVTRAFGRFPAPLLRLGPEDELPGVMSQWMRWNLQGRWEGNDGTDYEPLIRELKNPYLGVAGNGDRLFAPPDACRGLYEMIGSADKTFLLCGRSTGFSEDFDHTGIMIRRSARAELWPRLLEWIERRAR